MNKATKKNLVRFGVTPIILLLLLWLIYKQIQTKGSLQEQWNSLWIHWKTGSNILITVAFLLTPLNWMTEAKKWHYLLDKIEKVPYRLALSSTMTGMAFALVTPNKIGDFAGRILYLKNENKLRAIIATLIDNISQTVITFIMGIIGLIYLNLHFSGNWQVGALVAAIMATGALLFFYFRIDKVADWAEGKAWLRKFIIAIRVLKRYDKKDLLIMLLLSFVRFSIYNIQFVLFIKVFGADIPFTSAFFASTVMFWLITVIPSIFVVDLALRPNIAHLVFVQSGITDNNMPVIAASYMVWMLNWAVAAVIGSLLILTVRWFR